MKANDDKPTGPDLAGLLYGGMDDRQFRRWCADNHQPPEVMAATLAAVKTAGGGNLRRGIVLGGLRLVYVRALRDNDHGTALKTLQEIARIEETL